MAKPPSKEYMYYDSQCPQPCSRLTLTHACTGDSWTLRGKSGLVSLAVAAPFSWVPVHTRFCLCPQRVYFPVLCKFWQLSCVVNGDFLQEGLCHTQICCTQSPCPCSSPLLTCTATGHAQTQFCLSLCGVPGSWWAQGLSEPSEHFWWEWGLILNANLPFLLSCLGVSFAPGHGVPPHSCSSTDRLTRVSLILDVGYLLTGACSSTTQCCPATGVISPL